MSNIELQDMNGRMFSEGDYVLFSDAKMNLRVAKVRGIRPTANTFLVGLHIIKGSGVMRRRYSRLYRPDDFYKIEYVEDGKEL